MNIKLTKNNLKILQVFISSEKDYFRDFNVVNDNDNSQIIDKNFINRTINDMFAYTIQKKELKLIQTGRIIPRLQYKDKNNSEQSSSGNNDYDHDLFEEFITRENANHLRSYNDKQIERSLPTIITKQIQRSDFLYAAFTKDNQIQLVSEIHTALSMSIPVYLKFCNCSQYDFREIYKYTINSVLDYMTKRRNYFEPKYFQDNAILNNYWNNEMDYLNYLYFLPICLFCDQTCSKTSNNAKPTYFASSSFRKIDKISNKNGNVYLSTFTKYYNEYIDDCDNDQLIFNDFDNKKLDLIKIDSDLSDFIDYDLNIDGHGNKLICFSCYNKIVKELIHIFSNFFSSSLSSLVISTLLCYIH
jgi:hypothetical protein